MSSFLAKILAMSLPMLNSLVNGFSLYIITKPILSFNDMMGIKIKLPVIFKLSTFKV